MKYPDDFNTPAFPAGKFIAVSRFMATAVMLLFFAIICSCGIILWVKSSQTINPFVVSIRPNGERWSMVEHTNHQNEIPAYYVMQESLLNKFVKSWFTISDDVLKNQAVWSGACDRESAECTEQNYGRFDTCSIYCNSDDKVFDSFKNVVLPVYSQLETAHNAVWSVREIHATPANNIQESGGLWQISVIVKTNDMGLLRFLAYALIQQNADVYQNNMHYYIADFNAYRMN